MPQMAPLFWLLINLFMIFILLVSVIKMYYEIILPSHISLPSNMGQAQTHTPTLVWKW